MHVAKTKKELDSYLSNEPSIGFVPTMGALHDGHISLVQESVSQQPFTVVSIFVNPTQFNNPEDFEKYPIDTDRDLEMLESAGCNLVFLPTKEEMYSSIEEEKYIHDFGDLENKFEGAFRPGHFRGVGQIVHKLFEAVKPTTAYFGEKDFQQVQVIRKLVELIDYNTEIIAMPTIREKDGLAMSSRNRRLSVEQRSASLLIYKALSFAKEHLKNATPDAIRNHVATMFERDAIMKLEYFDLVIPSSLEPINSSNEPSIQGIIAAYADEIRLIDNMKLA